jgi:hypothetical protein
VGFGYEEDGADGRYDMVVGLEGWDGCFFGEVIYVSWCSRLLLCFMSGWKWKKLPMSGTKPA